MAQYGEVRVDYITYTTGVSPAEGNVTVPVSGLINAPTFSGDVIIGGDLNVNSNAIISGNVIVSGDLTVSGDINASGVTISGFTGLFDDGTEASPSITFAADQDTGFYRPGDNQVAISTSGTSRLFIADDGDIGINTSTPSRTLDVTGSARITSVLTMGSYIQGTTNLDLYGDASASAGLRIDSLGNVGVNVTPGTKFHVRGDNNLNVCIIDAQGTAPNYILDVRDDGTSVFRVDGSGYIGIGSSSPSKNLEVSDSVTNGPVIRLNNTNTTVNNNDEYGRLEWYTNDSSNGGTGISNYVAAHAEDAGVKAALTFGVREGVAGVYEAMRIDSSGRLLAGTSSARTDLIAGTRGGRVQVEAASSTSTDAIDNSSLCLTMGSSAPQGSANIFFTRTKSNSLGGVTSVGNNDILGGLYFQGTDGTDAVSAALIKAEVDGTPGANDMPGRLVFSTTADGASSPTERMRIDSSGRLLVGTSSALASSASDLLHLQTKTGGAINFGRNDSSVSEGNLLGRVRFYSNAGSNQEAARISAAADGTHANNDKPGRLEFYTTADGASSPTERMRIDSSGNVGIGTSSPSEKLHVYGDDPVIRLQQSTGTAGAAGLIISAAGSNSPANASFVQVNGGAIWGQTGGLGLRFGPTDRSVTQMVLNTNTGALLIGGTFPSSPNISLNANGSAKFAGSVSIGGTAAVNTIDEYEEGTWTPTFAFATAGTTNIAYDNNATNGTFGKYLKIGNIVYIWGKIKTSTFTFSGSNGGARVSGIPYWAAAPNESYGLNVQTYAGITGAPGDVIHLRSRGSSFFVFQRSSFGSSSIFDLSPSYFTSGTNLDLKFSGSFVTS